MLSTQNVLAGLTWDGSRYWRQERPNVPTWATIPHIEALISRPFRVGFLSDMATNAKTRKSLSAVLGGTVHGRILYLAPERQARAWLAVNGAKDLRGALNMCPWASNGCKESCLYTAGRGAMSNVMRARIARTLALLAYPALALTHIRAELEKAERGAARAGGRVLVRLNGTSDLGWGPFLAECGAADPASRIVAYDYTKNPDRALEAPAWYPQTYSLSEGTWHEAEALLRSGVNVAAVFRDARPARLAGFDCIDGDAHDVRRPEVDGRGRIIALSAKGRAKKDRHGFVLDYHLDRQLAVGRGGGVDELHASGLI